MTTLIKTLETFQKISEKTVLANQNQSKKTHNDNFQMLDNSQLNVTGYIHGVASATGAQEFEGKTSMQIGDMLLKDVETMSIHRHSTPLILDLDGDGIDLSSIEDGVTFDLTGDGVRDETAWTDAQNSFDDAFLVLDKNNFIASFSFETTKLSFGPPNFMEAFSKTP